jgi:hypothetical protein
MLSEAYYFTGHSIHTHESRILVSNEPGVLVPMRRNATNADV